jgi:hypothetical protein
VASVEEKLNDLETTTSETKSFLIEVYCIAGFIRISHFCKFDRIKTM